MADDKITVGIDLEDDLTPKIAGIKSALSEMAELPAAGGMAGGAFGKVTEEVGGLTHAFEELKSGFGYQFGLWNLAFMAAEQLGNALSEVARDAVIYTQLGNRMAGSNENATESFLKLAGAALMSGTSISETAKRVDELMSVGMGRGRATEMAGAIQELRAATGIDITAGAKAAERLRLSPEQALTMSQAGGPFARLEPEARAAMQEEAERPYREQALREGQRLEERLFENRVHNTERLTKLDNIARTQEMEDRQRMEDQAMEDAHYRISTQTEETNRAINREMEDRHRATNYAMEDTHRVIQQEMEDRHRMMSQQMEDQDRLHARQMGIAGGMRGVTQAAFIETVRGGSAGGGPLGRAIDMVAAEMERGYKQLEKDMGISRREAQGLIGAGVMSPQVLLQEAQAAREEERIEQRHLMEEESIMLEREMRLESIQEERKQELELLEERRRQEDQIHKMEVDFHNQEVKQSREHEKERIEMNRTMQGKELEHEEDVYQERLRLSHKYEDEAEKAESDRIAAQLKRSLDAIDAEEEYMKGATDRMIETLRMTMGQTGGFGGGDAETKQILNNIDSKLGQVLSGG